MSISKCSFAVAVVLAPCVFSGCIAGPTGAAAPAAGQAETTAASDPNAPPAVVAQCSGGLAAAADGLVDNLEDGDNMGAKVGGRGGGWYTGFDGKGSTIAPSDASPVDGGAEGTKKAVRFAGKTATGDGAWGASWGIALQSDGAAMYDASKFAGISFWAKAGASSAKKVRFKVGDVNTKPEGKVCTSGCYNHFGVDLTLTPEWKQYDVKFADMKQADGWGDPHPPSVTTNKLFSLDWSIDGGTDFDIWIDEVKFAECQ